MLWLESEIHVCCHLPVHIAGSSSTNTGIGNIIRL